MTDYNHDQTLQSALAALGAGDRDKAEGLARLAVKTKPGDAEGWSVLGLTLTGASGVDALLKAVGMEPGEPRWQLHLGQGFMARGDFNAAQPVLAKAAELSRGHPEAMTAWANCLLRLERYGDAAQVYGRVLQSHQTPELWMHAGDALAGANDTINAAMAYERAYNDQDRPAELSARLADIHIMLNQYDQAERFNGQVLAAMPKDPEAGLRAANLKRWHGDHSAALDIQRKFWRDNPGHAGLIAALLDDKDGDVLEAALALPEDEATDMTGRRRVSFALARHFDRAGDEAKAWEYAQLANSLYDDDVEYDGGAQHRAWLEAAIAAYARLPDQPQMATKMIYVMGPPRCGGSLLQSVIARAGGAASVGERGALLSWLIPALADPGQLAEKQRQLGASDLAGMAKAAGRASIYVDKTSPHIIVAGLLAKIHPGAKFVLPKRSTADMIVSMYFHDFSPEFAYTRSVQGIADYLTFQDEAGAAWRKAGLEIIDHDHDVFIQDPKGVSQALFAVLSLPWSEAVLDTDDQDAAIRTFSSRQVRGGVSRKYAGRGARYAKFLKAAGYDGE